ncbi:kinase-like domain-containing protein [Dactylonectria estremocensis]|uniref:EKC/KEOPS complex subunit BUD32 n=1 Tax=Dactylonectria estremocensis TaxID=1079267 RepID=A0A9P9CXB4_9HYPO|nr:kinase-like domain-containing protein [Dactylonectria estremocensis]
MQIIDRYETRKKIDGKFQFFCVKVIVKQNGEYYIGKWNDRKRPPDDFSQLEDVKIITTKGRGPALQPHWTTSIPPRGDCYLKKPSLEEYLDSGLEAHLEHEIEMCELVKRHPHPNLAVYYGCLNIQGRALGLLFQKYEETLLERVNPQRLSKRHFVASSRPLVRCHMRHWFESLRSALQHLHSMGFVHNDITPANIMLDQNDSPMIIDFGSLCGVGESLQHTKRTHGWHNETVAHAARENDLDALGELETWLFGSVEDLKFAG